jgi:serine/threonine-protein kinase HipA
MNTEVWIDWRGEDHLVGHLYEAERGTAASFHYSEGWLTRGDTFSIDPTGLPLQRAPHHAPVLFGAVQDCGPDRWGRLLIERAVRKKVLPAKLWRELDYVLALDDVSRIGALKFRIGGGDFLAPRVGKLPPLLRLATLLNAADAIEVDTETAEDLRYLLAEGSPLGGARPKSAVALEDGALAIAKFPKAADTRDIAAGEILALSLAREAGISVPDHRLVQVAGRHVAIIRRFDRDGPRRVPFISAATLIGLPPGRDTSYVSIAEGIRQCGDSTQSDLQELWRRLVFSLLVSNFDDHARNHGFLMHQPGRWALSPAYDINPVPQHERAQMTKTAISEDDDELSIAKAMAVAGSFSLKPKEAKESLRSVVRVVRDWRVIAKRLRIKAATLAAYESAFEQPLLAEAEKLCAM